MQETTPEFHHLTLALATARKIIQDLPDHSIRDDLDELKLKSYVLLQHAAVEEYLERASVFVLRECMKTFDQEAQIAEPLIAVCGYYNVCTLDFFSGPSNSYKISDTFLNVCRKAIEMHVVALDGVHGIKTKDQDTILNPLGIKLHDFDHVLSQKLNSLGRNRGSVAHLFRIRQIQPKIALENDTVTLINLLQPFDNELCRKTRVTYRE